MGHTNVVKLLVEEHRAAVDARDGALCTPLHAASEGGHPVVVELLLRLGAEVDARNGKKQTPLHYACGYGQMEAAQQLVIRGASVGAQDAKGNTPLHLACGLAGTDVVRLLLAHGSPFNALNDRRRHPLHLACRGGHLEVAITLLEYGADPSAKDAHGKQAIDMVGAGRRIPQGLRFDIINTLERYQMGEYAIARAPLSSTRSLRQMWRDRDSGESTPRASTARAGSLPSSAVGGAGQGGAAAAAAAAGAAAAAAAAAAAGGCFDGGGGSTIYSSRGGSISRKGSMSLDGFSTASMGAGGEGGGPLSVRGAAMRHSSRGFSEGDGRGDGGGGGGGGGRSPRWTVGAAVAGRLEGMRARELGASLRAKVQENEAMKRYVESVTEEMRALQQKISQQSSPASPPPPLPPPPPILYSYAGGGGGGGGGAGTAAPLVTSRPGEEQLSIAEKVARGIGAARQDPAAQPGAGAGEGLLDGRRNPNPSLRGATALGADGGLGTEAAAAVPKARVVQVDGGSAVAEAPAMTMQRAGGDAGAVAAAGLKGGEFSSFTAAAGAPAAPGYGDAQGEVGTAEAVAVAVTAAQVPPSVEATMVGGGGGISSEQQQQPVGVEAGAVRVSISQLLDAKRAQLQSILDAPHIQA
ncbi:conserved unknown protein [Ectocarpus siliculosus]|uniref:Uncharacterized protein n=1 Tax=Ectocarpus siliculosus TaxID=2880 RepID=D8LLZ4_ECTSI|nr:conserved unknown protein [Ectocarpus siliculosus]|eukprot:CBN77208.1 conserved unknown protein [Ectocarpus siliculosus]